MQSGRCPRPEISAGRDLYSPHSIGRVAPRTLWAAAVLSHLGTGAATFPTLLLSRLFCCLSCLARWRLTCPIPRELQQGGVQPTASSAMNSPVWAPVLSACLECPGDSLPAAFIVLTKSSGTFYLWSNRGTLIKRKGADTAIFSPQILTRKKKKSYLFCVLSLSQTQRAVTLNGCLTGATGSSLISRLLGL